AEYQSILQAILPNGAFGFVPAAGVAYLTGLPGYNTTRAECQQAMADALWTPLNNAYLDMHIDWVAFLDDAAKAGEQGRRLQDAIGNLKGAEQSMLGNLRGSVGGHALATQIASLSQLSDVTAGLPSADARNVSPWLAPPQGGLDQDKMW